MNADARAAAISFFDFMKLHYLIKSAKHRPVDADDVRWLARLLKKMDPTGAMTREIKLLERRNKARGEQILRQAQETIAMAAATTHRPRLIRGGK